METIQQSTELFIEQDVPKLEGWTDKKCLFMQIIKNIN